VAEAQPDTDASAVVDAGRRLANAARDMLAIFEVPDTDTAVKAAGINGARQEMCDKLNIDVADHDRMAVRLALASMAERGDIEAIEQVVRDIGALPGVEAEITEGTSDDGT
jgi:hypothetical protein